MVPSLLEFIKWSTLSIGEFFFDGVSKISQLYFEHPRICYLCCLNFCCGRILLYAPPTSTSVQDDLRSCYREGFIVTLSLEDGSMGFGEVRCYLKFVSLFLLYSVHGNT